MIVVTGAVGFIGSCLARFLNKKGYKDLILVDNFDRSHHSVNLNRVAYCKKIDRTLFLDWLEKEAASVDYVLHIGARTDTTEMNISVFNRLNLQYSKTIATVCSKHNIPLIYASSAATYGLGKQGFDDSLLPEKLTPLNPYGASKNDFDHWLLQQDSCPPNWAGLKFFNVYGPNEYHKGRMASVIWHCYHQILKTGQMRLFRSHRPDYEHGEQSRDFIYVKDLLNVIDFMMHHSFENGLYNVGTGRAESFNSLAEHTFKAMNIPSRISYIDTPSDIRESYQYFTEATLDKLRSMGYQKSFFSLEEGIHDYVKHYLIPNQTYL